MPHDMEEFVEVVAQRRLRLILLPVRDTVDALQHLVCADLELTHLVPHDIANLRISEQEVALREVGKEDDGRIHSFNLSRRVSRVFHVAVHEDRVPFINRSEDALLLGARPVVVVRSRGRGPGIDVLLAEGLGDGKGRSVGHGWVTSSTGTGLLQFFS